VKKLFKGNIIFSKTSDTLEALPLHYVAVEDGIVSSVTPFIPKDFADAQIIDCENKLIIPGFCDLHVHAAQLSNMGLGLDKELLPWLEDYTFPEEARFSDTRYADKKYRHFVKLLWQNGTTRSAVFTTIHAESTIRLMELFSASGLGAYVGKLNMDRNTVPALKESTAASLENTQKWLTHCAKYFQAENELVKPIITPRFVPHCTTELQKGLGKLSLKYNVPVQSHLSENRDEIEWVKKLHPESPSYTAVYDEAGLLGQTPTIMAHCIWNTPEETALLASKNVWIAHCPTSNMNVKSGIAPIQKYMNQNIKIGLGSDISGGNTLSMPSVIRAALQVSNLYWVYVNQDCPPLSLFEAFYLATKGGGSFFGKVGSFEKGYEFDALIIDDTNLSDENERSLPERLSRYIYCGDDRQIESRYVRGEYIPEPFS